MVNSTLDRELRLKKAITQGIYDLIFIIFITRKLQLSSLVRIYLMCPVPNQLQSRGVSPCIVTHLQALLKTHNASRDNLFRDRQLSRLHLCQQGNGRRISRNVLQNMFICIVVGLGIYYNVMCLPCAISNSP